VKTRIFAGAAVAALIGIAQPAFAADASLDLPTAGVAANVAVSSAVAAFAAHRQSPLWVDASGRANTASERLLSVLDRSELDGLRSGPVLANRARALLSAAAAGDKSAAIEADRLLSSALVMYAQAIRTPPASMSFANNWVAPPRTEPQRLLASAAAAKSLDRFVADLALVNPVYAELREAAFANMKAGIAPDARVRSSLDRARIAPSQSRYVMVDAASATLFMVEDGRIADRMKVIVGKAESATPMVASTIYHATLNPYWNVPDDLAQSLIGPRVVAQGASYLKERNYDVLADFGSTQTLDPATIDWKGVVDGTVQVRLRQRPNPANSMGNMKFGFANDQQIFLHDSPNKALFAEAERQLSNGCIRLEDAQRFANWLMAGASLPTNPAPETSVALPKPVPIYVTYLTAQPANGAIAYVNDVYRQDTGASYGVSVAARR
jgi:murein L,D-transpeptidase YcbB/YkuD